MYSVTEGCVLLPLSGTGSFFQSAEAASYRLDASLSSRRAQLGRKRSPPVAQRHQKAAQSGQSRRVRQPA